jgi:short-subunit dehydrogenase
MTRRLCLITGASAGIGAAFARLYAAKGYDLALTARRADHLQALADEIQVSYGVEALVFPADLGHAGAIDALIAAIAARGRTVDVLVNNAGYGLPGLYARTRWSDQQAFLQVLLVAVCELTHKLLPGMVERGFGRIVNVASLAGLVPGMPSHTLYGPTKSFLVKFSQGLHTELVGTGVHVTALCPGFTRSEFHDANGTRDQAERLPAFLWQDAETVAEAGYAACEANRAVEITGWPNRIIAALARLTPDRLILTLTGRAARRMRGV